MKKISLCPVLLVFLYMGCAYLNGNQRLAEIDSLIVAEDYDSAYHLLHSMDSNTFASGEDKIHYDLLYVKVGCLAGHPLSSDSLLDAVIHYYRENKNNDRLSDAYYYKAVYEYQRTQYKEAIVSLKTAEDLAKKTDNLRQQCKISEMLSFINGMYENTDLQLQYAKQSLDLSKRIGNKRWIADAYYRVALAYSQQNNEDSARFYTNATTPYIKYVREIDLPYFLANLGCIYKESDPQLARKYYEEALSHKELSKILSHLADVYYCEGNTEEAYRLWKRALATDDPMPKDNIIHNLLEYDVERGKVDEVCQRVNDIFAIKDSIINNLKNDTIKDLQTRFDHEVAMNASNKQLIRWQWISGATGFVCLLLAIIWMHRRHKMRNLLQTRQIEISSLVSLLNSKENDVLKSESQIAKLQEEQHNKAEQLSELTTEIQELKEQKEVAESDCLELRHKIENWAGVEAEKIRVGAMLIEKVNQNVPVRHWPNEDLESCIDYYCAVHREFSSRMSRSYRNLTLKDKMYLILDNMGKDKKDISIILGIDERSVRSNKFRISKKAI